MVLMATMLFTITNFFLQKWIEAKKIKIDQLSYKLQRLVAKQPRMIPYNNTIDYPYVTALRKRDQLFHQLFEAFYKDKLQGVCFINIKSVGNKIAFVGNAHTLYELIQFFKRWKGRFLFSEYYVDQLKDNLPQQSIKFQFIAKIK